MSTDDSDRNDDGKEEPRAKDLLTRPREQLEQQMDAATIAQLASWFDMPNLAVAQEQAELVAQESDEERQLAERAKRKADACAAADPRLLHYVARHERAQIVVAPTFDVKSFVDESIVNPVVRAQLERQAAATPDVSEYEQPQDVYNIVHEHNAPQALLRDLYRPETEFNATLESPFEELPDMDPTRQVREAIREHIKTEWPEARTMDLGAEGRAAGKAIMSEPWPAHLEVVQRIKKERESL